MICAMKTTKITRKEIEVTPSEKTSIADLSPRCFIVGIVNRMAARRKHTPMITRVPVVNLFPSLS